MCPPGFSTCPLHASFTSVDSARSQLCNDTSFAAILLHASCLPLYTGGACVWCDAPQVMHRRRAAADPRRVVHVAHLPPRCTPAAASRPSSVHMLILSARAIVRRACDLLTCQPHTWPFARSLACLTACSRVNSCCRAALHCLRLPCFKNAPSPTQLLVLQVPHRAERPYALASGLKHAAGALQRRRQQQQQVARAKWHRGGTGVLPPCCGELFMHAVCHECLLLCTSTTSSTPCAAPIVTPCGW